MDTSIQFFILEIATYLWLGRYGVIFVTTALHRASTLFHYWLKPDDDVNNAMPAVNYVLYQGSTFLFWGAQVDGYQVDEGHSRV